MDTIGLPDSDDEESYWDAHGHEPEFLAAIARAREQVAKGQVIPHEDLKKELGIP